jgi:hypothetical protein
MVTVKLLYQDDGKPAKNEKVALGFDGFSRGVTGDEWTDDRGEAHFDNDPGNGVVYHKGSTVYKGRIEGRVVVYI